MQKKWVNLMAAGLMLFLAGCQQTTSPVTNLFTPFPSSISLAQSVREALYRSNDPVIAQVRVDTNQNTVILSGYVKKIRQSDTAEQLVREVQGVQAIQNNIIVRP